ncbi:hypothetical protein G113_05463, partial [Aeromonas molluscorum 848]
MGHCQQGGEQAAQQCDAATFTLGQQEGDQQQAEQAGGRGYPEAEPDGLPQTWLGPEPQPGRGASGLAKQDQQAAEQGSQSRPASAAGSRRRIVVAVTLGPGAFQHQLPTG